MGWTKRKIVKKAFELLGIAQFADVEQYESAMESMDAMIAGWTTQGIHIKYSIPTDSDGGSLDSDSGLPDWAIEAVFCNLAVKISASYGVALPQYVATTANLAYNSLLVRAIASIPQRQIPGGALLGAGYKGAGYGSISASPPRELIDDGDGGYLDIEM